MKQKTYMMLKPDAFHEGKKGKILQELRLHDLQIEKSVELEVDMEVMKTLLDHYQEVIDSMDSSFYFPGKLFQSFYYGSCKIMPMLVTYEGKEDIITYTRALIGKTNPADAGKETIRGKYSDDSYEKAGAEMRLVQNLIHASDSHESAERELHIWEKYLHTAS